MHGLKLPSPQYVGLVEELIIDVDIKQVSIYKMSTDDAPSTRFCTLSDVVTMTGLKHDSIRTHMRERRDYMLSGYIKNDDSDCLSIFSSKPTRVILAFIAVDALPDIFATNSVAMPYELDAYLRGTYFYSGGRLAITNPFYKNSPCAIYVLYLTCGEYAFMIGEGAARPTLTLTSDLMPAGVIRGWPCLSRDCAAVAIRAIAAHTRPISITGRELESAVKTDDLHGLIFDVARIVNEANITFQFAYGH